jgi:hypothetical protein
LPIQTSVLTQARTLFVDAGYQVDQLQAWDWLSAPVTTFQVHDPARHQVLLVQVYPDVAQAQRGSERPVEGYSSSTWIDNLASFQANADDYQRAQAAAQARSVGMTQSAAQVATATMPAQRVDTLYTSLVLNALTNDPDTVATAAPVILAGAQVVDAFAGCGFQVGNPGLPGNDRYLSIQDLGAAALAADPRESVDTHDFQPNET